MEPITYTPRRRRAGLRVRKPHPIRRRIALGLTIFLGFAVSGAVGAGAYFYPAIRTAFAVTGHSFTTATPSAAAHTSATPLPVATTSSTPQQPFTLLLLGSDDDAKFSADEYLTQSMILARVDPVEKHVTMLSIPRDLYVPLSTGGEDKIDKAYLDGGIDAAVTTVERNFNVHVDHYAWIGLRGLITLIDKVGGVDIVATNPVLDDFYPADLNGGNPYEFERVAVLPGPQHLDGTHALEYVRSRHGDLRSDFGRSERQQQVLIALRAKAKALGLADLPDISTSLNNEFSTDMSIADTASLLPIAGDISLDSIQQLVLLPPYTHGETIGSQDVVMPNWDEINPLVEQYFPTA